MMRLGRWIFAAFAAAGSLSAQQPCESLSALKLPHTTITSAVSVAATPQAAAHCAVQGTARPTSDSEIKFEVWMPLSGWNGKYQQAGNGGWAGTIPRAAFPDTLSRGYAVSGTDDGHTGAGAQWSIGHPEKLIDFGWRAVHETRMAAVAIIGAFYGHDPSRDYFFGCSDGGREALMEAQRFADDFDGIIAGAPANNWTHLLALALWTEQSLLNDPAATIPQAKLPAIQKAAVDQCDALDGVKDGLIEDPRACHVDPAKLACKGADSNDCLTAPQIGALRKMYSGPVNPRTGVQIHPGFAPGVEAVPGTWSDWLIPGGRQEPAAFGFANTFYLQAVYEGLKNDFHTLNFDSDVALGDQKAAALNSTNPDLRSFRARGGKLIQFHGWGDAAIPAQDSIDYYELVQAFMTKYPNGRVNATGPVDDFYRLFLVPGMGHCSGGIGPNVFGNGRTIGSKDDPERDLLSALDRWVEKGVAPNQLIGSGKAVDDPAKTLTHPLCAYPKKARYKGSGDINDASNFTCAAP